MTPYKEHMKQIRDIEKQIKKEAKEIIKNPNNATRHCNRIVDLNQKLTLMNLATIRYLGITLGDRGKK